MKEIIPFGETSLLINFVQEIDPMVHDQVLGLYSTLNQLSIQGITFCIPAYCSLTIGFEPSIWTFETLREKLEEIAESVKGDSPHNSHTRTLFIPVCYAPLFSWDMEEIMGHSGLSKETVVKLHHSMSYRVYMLGFLPGFAYLGKIDAKLACPRKAEPRTAIEPGCVGIAGFQTGIYPSKAPGGWQIVGRTPIRTFQHEQEDPFVFRPGDEVNFFPISLEEYEEKDWDTFDPLSKDPL